MQSFFYIVCNYLVCVDRNVKAVSLLLNYGDVKLIGNTTLIFILWIKTAPPNKQRVVIDYQVCCKTFLVAR